jgi:dihydroneopterin aldolase
LLAEITLENIQEYAYHGCLPEEANIGSFYRIDLTCTVNITTAIASDELKDAADYVLMQQIVSKEMRKRSNLLERVVYNISNCLLNEIPSIQKIDLRVRKLNPPINGNTESVSLRIIKNREVL